MQTVALTVSFRTKIQNINKTISEGGCTGYQADPTMLIVTATIDKSLPYDLVFSLDAAYSLGYYTGISTHPETFANNDFNLQINLLGEFDHLHYSQLHWLLHGNIHYWWLS